MDRAIVYPGSIPLDTDLLATNRNAMVAIGALAQATLGTATVVDGLTVTPTAPASLSVVCAPGSITQFTTLDQNAYGSLPADTADGLVKMGVNLAASTIAFTAPTTTGQAIAYMIEASFQESDANPVVLPYYNAANPASPYLGPNNAGTAQSTQRIQRVQLQVKASPPAAIGSQVIPSVDSGWSGLAIVTVAYGQTQITASSIAQMATSPALQFKLPSLRPGFSQLQSFAASGVFTIPMGVTRLRATVIGGGGSGGSHASLPGGGGGSGATGIRIVSGVTPGAAITVTVGSPGLAPSGGANGAGGNGGTSSFGAYVSATGGFGGGGGSVSTTTGGGGGGTAVGGDLNFAGSCGTDSTIAAAKGGDGGGAGCGRGTTGYLTGLAAQGYGGGGGGGGASNTSGTGSGAPGGNGGPGFVIVEY